MLEVYQVVASQHYEQPRKVLDGLVGGSCRFESREELGREVDKVPVNCWTVAET
jgi:hypothetical protein